MNLRSRTRDAWNCHPRAHSPTSGTSPHSPTCGGLAPDAISAHVGTFHSWCTLVASFTINRRANSASLKQLGKLSRGASGQASTSVSNPTHLCAYSGSRLSRIGNASAHAAQYAAGAVRTADLKPNPPMTCGMLAIPLTTPLSTAFSTLNNFSNVQNMPTLC